VHAAWTVLDSQRMKKLLDDLTAEQAGRLQQAANQRSPTREFTFETLKKSEPLNSRSNWPR